MLKNTASEVDRLEAELDELLSEAAIEIANLDGRDNIVYRRLRAMQSRLSSRTADQPLRKFTASESSMGFPSAGRSQKSG